MVVAQSLVQRGAHVIITSRSLDRGQVAAQRMQQAAQNIPDSGKVQCPPSILAPELFTLQGKRPCHHNDC